VIKSDGGSTSYYQLPEGATELNDLIEHKKMSFALGNCFKACYRLGEKEGADLLYDLNKIVFFANRMIDQEKKRQAPTLKDWANHYRELVRKVAENTSLPVDPKPDPDLDLFAYWDESQMYRTERPKQNEKPDPCFVPHSFGILGNPRGVK